MLNLTRAKLLIISACACASVAALGFLILWFPSNSSAPSTLTSPLTPSQSSAPQSEPQQILSHASDPDATSDAIAHSIPKRALINTQAVNDALDKLKLTDTGDLLIDNRGLQVLYGSMGYGGTVLSSEQLAAITDQLTQSLPTEVAEQASAMVLRFNEYLRQKNYIDELYPQQSSSALLQIRLDEINALRDLIFGRDDAEKLFAQQRAHEVFMVESFRLAKDSTLSNPEREQEMEQKRSQLQQRLVAVNFDLPNWQQRLAAFQAEKQAILNSALTETEKAKQIDRIYANSFSEEEVKSLQYLRLDEF